MTGAVAAPEQAHLVHALGAATLGLALLALLTSRRNAIGANAEPIPIRPPARRAQHRSQQGADSPARALHASAALLAASVLADSAVEHYRAQFDNPGMFAPLVTSALTLATAAGAACGRPSRARVYAGAVAVGVAGTGFHAYNVLHRPGGLGWANLFYAAPLVAPAALVLSGLIGLAARQVQAGAGTLARIPAWRAMRILAAIGLAGSSAEAALLHFRGAYHNPAMWLPVTVPPVGAALLVAASMRQAQAAPHRFTRNWLALTAMLGVAGSVFHARGIARQMGGWRNWSQNLLSGPPLPAPPSFTALALAGWAALALPAGAADRARVQA